MARNLTQLSILPSINTRNIMNRTTDGSSFNIVGVSGRDATDMPTVATNIFGPRHYSQFNNRKDSKMSNKQSSSDDNSMPSNMPTPMAG